MSFAICHLSVVPLRNSASDKSEQISQLLFGEIVEILETKGKSWTKARCTWDNCIGWVKSRQLKTITPAENEIFKERFAYCLDLFNPLLSNDYTMTITLGARLPDFDGMKFIFDGETYFYSGQAVFPENLLPTTERVLKISRRYLLAPYQWGGRSPMGIDAAGLTQMIFKIIGINLRRSTEQQVHQGNLIDFIDQAKPGDLAFFENNVGNISHVGMLLPDSRIIHAFEQVRIDKIDHFGIFNEDEQRYTHRLRVIKRMLKTIELPETQRQEERKGNTQVLLFN